MFRFNVLEKLFLIPSDDNGGQASNDTYQETEDERKKRQSKEYSERLNKDKDKLRNEAAQAAGFKDWNDMQANSLDKKLLEQGIQPEAGAPIIRSLADDLMSRDPRILEAERIIAERREEQSKTAVADINSNFGTTYTSIDELDESVKLLIEKGLSPFEAFMAKNYSKLQPKQPNGKDLLDASKAHMKALGGTDAPSSRVVNLSTDQFTQIRKMTGLTMNDEQISEYLVKHPEIKLK